MSVAQFPGVSRTIARKRKVIVVGAGIAGASCALSLARRGIEVDLLERASYPGAETSSNPAALVRTFMTLDNGVRSRFTWSAFLYAVRCYRELHCQAGFRWHETGLLQLARDHGHMERLMRAAKQRALPGELVRPVDAREGTSLCGAQTRETGIWFPSAGYVDGQPSCNAMVETGGSSIRFVSGGEAARIERIEGGWQILDATNAPLAQGDSVILANGCRAQALLPEHDLQLMPVRGQVTAIPPESRDLHAPVCRDGYVTPAENGMHYVGGTFDESMSIPIVIDQDHETNVSRAAHILPSVFENASTDIRSGWAGVRCVSRDRVPVVGEVFEDVYASLAMGSRGFTWAPLAGELLASLLAGESFPVERSVANGVLPQRLLAGAG
jgi:tRNA 5-methylaminomethyl-2-thiouridine biosynthesis bifunctional protein